jgi:DNA-binding transcriptional LysR family regulator
MDLTIHHLRCFLAVARELHFGRAAQQLHLSPSSLSEQISALERRLSRPLFHRSSRTVELTEHGQELVPLALPVVEAMDQVLDWAHAESAEPRIRVGLMVSSPGFRTILAAAAQQMPQVQWEIRQLGFLGGYQALAKAEVDCIVVSEIGETPAPEFTALPLWQEGCVLVVSEQHPLAGRSSVRLAELVGETFVSGAEEAAARWLTAVTAPDGAAPRLLPVAHNFEEVLELCGAGLGVNIAGESAQTTYARPGIRFLPIQDAPTATTYLYLQPHRRFAPVEDFARLAVRVARRGA